MVSSVAIIVPTIGSSHLEQCVNSVKEQTYKNIVPYYILDGEEHYHKIPNHLEFPLQILDKNVGAGGWYGHRIYAAFSFLVNADYVCFLDEDNWLEPNHIKTMVQAIEGGEYDWGYSLRKVYDKNSNYVCQDDCESLGKWLVWNNPNYHIDTSCFCVKRNVLVQVAQAWYGQYGQDRIFFSTLKYYFPKFVCSQQYTLNYRCGSTNTSVQPEYFIAGNKYMKELYGDKLPWRNVD